MKEIYSGKHQISYGQLVLRDAFDKKSYPEPNGKLPWKGFKGLCVPAKDDTEVNVKVFSECSSCPIVGYQLLTEAVITIGIGNIEVGNITSANTRTFDWPPGKVSVSAYYSGSDSPELATAIIFILN